MITVLEQARQAREAAAGMGLLDTAQKNEMLKAMARALIEGQEEILQANAEDLAHAKENGVRQVMMDRLALTSQRIADMAVGVEQVAALPDPVGLTLEMIERPNGLKIEKRSVPMGVVGIIFEARPNVTADAIALCVKSGNACVLRGGKEAFLSNCKIAEIMAGAAQRCGMPAGAVQLIQDTTRQSAMEMMRCNGYIDVLIPRGGAGLIRSVVENASVPVIETGVGNCHVYVDKAADLEMASKIVINGKCQRPSVCNAIETLLVHKDIADVFLPDMAKMLIEKGVALRGCDRCLALVPEMKAATEEDYATEFNDLILAVKVVDTVDDAIAHIAKYGTGHSECIVTQDQAAVEKFQKEVDAAAVYANASTRFTDGFEFGFGAEIGISTQKLHARGPMGLPALTSYKYVVTGHGQVRG
ncbi:MAG: glutamate-5-semialdehyde dehydrogenase [Clostridiales bacterium]|nr:glutamate-5-semialdehyde dehydrogenase [Clostridiales bacterium]